MTISFLYSAGLESEAELLSEELKASLVEVRTHGRGAGSGLVWRDDGLIITNAHVVPQDNDVEVGLRNGQRYPALEIKRDQQNDLASIRIDAKGLTAAPIGDSKALRVGQLLFAVGNPMGMRGVVTSGVFSANVLMQGGRELLQTAIELRPGNSGGALADVYGRVVGINSMVTGPRLALSVPSHVVERFLAETGERPTLGVGGQIVLVPAGMTQTQDSAQTWGLVVSAVKPGSAAETAGIMIGDVLLEIDGNPVSTTGHDFNGVSQQSKSGEASVRLLRGGKVHNILVTPTIN